MIRVRCMTINRLLRTQDDFLSDQTQLRHICKFSDRLALQPAQLQIFLPFFYDLPVLRVLLLSLRKHQTDLACNM